MDYMLMYNSTLLVSFALTLILYLYHKRYWDTVTHVPLQAIYFLNMTSAAMCIAWCITDGRPELSGINWIANIIEFNCMGFCGYFWLKYCLNFVDIPSLRSRTASILMALPVTVIMCMIISSPWTHWAFYIDEGGFFRRGTIYFMQLNAYIYLLVSSTLCLWYRRKCNTSSERRHLSVLSMFPLSPALFGIIQVIAPSGLAPTLQFSIMISLLLVFVDELDQKITRDSLTHLTNRYEIERILQNRMHGMQKNGPKLYVLMCDLDDFKSINDNFGHQQGDEALKTVGNVLNQLENDNNSHCARMSGDEFLSMVELDSMEEAQLYRSNLEKELAKACSGLPYTLHMSIGIAEYDGTMPLMQLMDSADEDMYRQKRKHKHTGSAAV